MYNSCMAIKHKTNGSGDQEKLVLTISNGDIEAINRVMADYGFKTPEAAMRYMIFAMLNNDDDYLYIRKGGDLARVTPSHDDEREK